MLYQLNVNGQDKVQVAIERFKMFEPEEGYYLAFSGGKDSIVIKKLAEISGVKFDAHYNHTSVDAPEQIKYMKKYHNDVITEFSYDDTGKRITMWNLIPRKLMPPTRLARYCCDVLKESGGAGRFVVTGVRWDESIRRKKNRQLIEFDRYGSKSKQAIKKRKIFLMSDNEDKRRMIEQCSIKGKHILNPIVDWTNEEVWEFIKSYDLPYCELYEQGFNRLGCIGCPMQGKKGMIRDFKRWPKYKANYLKAFRRMLEERGKRGLETSWNNENDVMNWWIYNQ